MWFQQLTGFKEKSSQQVRSNLTIEGDTFVSKVNGKRFTFGQLQIASLAQLKEQSPGREIFKDKIKVSEIVADARTLHDQAENSGALFQAASQFNLLEMVGPHIMPENGIDRYEEDYTQGPACAIACGAGTIYRNYFVELPSQVGQSRHLQIDCLDLIGEYLENDKYNYWTMRNGYAMFSKEGLLPLDHRIADLTPSEREVLKNKLKVGVQWNTEVTSSLTKHKVSQIYCSALPVAYCQIDPKYFESFSRIILEATYEATLFAALINFDKTNNDKVYLTLVGGSAFGNEESWILESMSQALGKFRNTPLDVQVVSYRASNPNLINCFQRIHSKRYT